MNKIDSIDKGHGENTLVFVHGLCCHPSDYQWHINSFSNSLRVIAPILRGHSKDGSLATDMSIENLAADVVQLLIEKNVQRTILCGHSLGTRVVLEIQAQLPEVVSGLVLIDGSNSVSNNLDAALKTFDTITEDKKIKSWIQDSFDQMFLPDTFAEEQAMYRERIAQMSNSHLATLYRNLIIWDANRFVDCVQQATPKPVLILQSTIRAADASRRSLEPEEIGDFPKLVESHHPGTQTIAYPNRSHFIHLDEPELLLNDINNWMKTNNLF